MVVVVENRNVKRRNIIKEDINLSSHVYPLGLNGLYVVRR